MRELGSDPERVTQYREALTWPKHTLPAWTQADDAAARAIESAGGSMLYSEIACGILEKQGFRQRLSLSALIVVAVSEYVERAAL
jgi:hypothetical protein